MRSAPLPWLLLSFNYGAYLLAGLIALFSAGGISESEEWRIFIIGWLTIPFAGPALAFGMAHLKRTRYATIESFYPLLLAANALLWVGYFAYHFPPPWIFKYTIAPQALHPLVWLLPLVNLLALFTLNRGEYLCAKLNTTGLYALLPLAALYIGLNFSGFQIDQTELLVKTWWPEISSFAGKTGAVDYDITAGETFYSDVDSLLSIDVTSKLSATLRFSLPWTLAKGSRLTAWHVEVGQWVEANRLLLEFDSDFFHTEIHSRVPFQLTRKGYQLGEIAEPTRTLFSYHPALDDDAPKPDLLYAALVLGLISLLASRLKILSLHPVPPIAIDIAVLLSIFLLVFDSAYLVEPHHYNFYLGPVNDVLHGKSLLVDINCQYGVGNIYFLALLFKLLPLPLNYQSFSLQLNALLVLQYAFVYLLMRHLLSSQFIAALALTLAVAVGYFSQADATFPSTGPLRFGLAYALLALFALRMLTGPRPSVQIAIYALVGLSALWSFETFTYTVVTYLSAEFYALLWDPRQLKQRLHRLHPLIIGPTLAIAIGHLLLALFTYLRAGTWPTWSHYFEYLALYSVDEYGTLTIEAWRPWVLFIAVYFLSLLLLLRKALSPTKTKAAPFALIAGLTGFGIVQFTYFLGRSHHNNLYHICIPSICIACYWFVYLQRDVRQIPRGFIRAATYCFFVVVFVLLAKAAPEFAAKWPRSPLYTLLYSVPDRATPWSAVPSDPVVRDATILIERYAADQDRIALFLYPELTTETLILSQKTHIFPLSTPGQDNLLPSAHARALAYEHGMQEGDYLFIARNHALNKIQHATLAKLLEKMNGQYADSTEHVYAIRLSAPQPADSD